MWLRNLRKHLFWLLKYQMIFYDFILKRYLNSVTVSRDEKENLAGRELHRAQGVGDLT